jgi:hypothetical protein
MIVKGEITKKGILSPITDIPSDSFLDQLKNIGIQVKESVDQLT